MTPRIVQWPGASGRWYAHTVFPWDRLPDVENANFILVAARGQDAGAALFIGASEALTRELPLRPEWSAAQMQGLTHVHVHLLAADARERETIRADLLACVETPLNGDAGDAAGRAGRMRMTPGDAVRWAPESAVLPAPDGAAMVAPDGAARLRAPDRAALPAPLGAVAMAPGGAALPAPNGAVRWLGGRQPSQRAVQMGRDFVLPQAAATRRAG
jgi:hypothetical protein